MINHYGKPEKGSKGLTLGSVIEVSVVSPELDKEGAQFALDQTPEVQAALSLLVARFTTFASAASRAAAVMGLPRNASMPEA